MDPPVSFGQTFRAYRRARDLTQDELARRAYCVVSTIKKIEADERRPSRELAERFAQVLDVPQADRPTFLRLARGLRPDAAPPLPALLPALMPQEVGAEDLSGREVRGYALRERLGIGGFGAVYRAVQSSVQREVAIKIILPRLANHPDFIRRFAAEAQFIAGLEHPHIVPLYDFWREPDSAYLVMRYLRGGSLAAALRNGPLPLHDVRVTLQQIGAALLVAHRANVVHRDLKPANVLRDSEGNAYLADFGIAKSVSTTDTQGLTQAGAIVGSPEYLSPEQILAEPVSAGTDIYSLGIMLYELLTGSRPFPAQTPAALLRLHLTEPLPSLRARRPELPESLDLVLSRATAKDPAERYAHVGELVAAFDAAVVTSEMRTPADLPATPPGAPATLALVAPEVGNPYKGLRAFAEADADDFFGRSVLIGRLLERLAEEGEGGRFLAVVGPSGSGKSSVVRAGLVPALRQGGVPGSETWFITDLIPGPHPLDELELALLRVAARQPADLAEQLRRDTRGLVRAARLVLPDDDSELVLVVDQFEELFTLVADDAARTHMLDSLVAAVTDPRSRVRVIVTLRADFYDRPLVHARLGALMRERTEVVLPLDPDELEDAIVAPARRAGIVVEPELVAEIVRDVADQPGALPLLQYALSELFEQRAGRTLTRAVYRGSGGVRGALSRRAEVLYLNLTPAAQQAARQMFLRLVTLGEGSEDTRRRVVISELASLSGLQSGAEDGAHAIVHEAPDVPRSPLDEAIDVFSAARLLTFDRDPRTRRSTVEVAHEALIREWARLRGWIDESRALVRVQRQLAEAADIWAQQRSDADFLALGGRLAQFVALAERAEIALTPAERAYLDASLAQQDRHVQAERDRQTRELAQAQALADEQRARAEAAQAAATAAEQATQSQRQAARRLRVLAGALALFLALAAVLSTFAFQQRVEAERQARLANARAWSAAALDSLDTDPERSLLLSLHAAETTRAADGMVLPEAEAALRRALPATKLKLRLEQPGVSFGMDWSPDGMYVAIQSYAPEGTKILSVWDSALHTRIISVTTQSVGTWVDFSPDGRLVAAHGDLFAAAAGEEQPIPRELTTQIYDLATGQLRYELPLLTPTFSRDGTRVAGYSSAVLTGADDQYMIYDVATGQLLHRAAHGIPTADLMPIGVFSPDLAFAVEVLVTDELSVRDTVTGAELARVPSAYADSRAVAVRFSPDSQRLAVGWLNGTVQLYAVAGEEVRLERTLLAGEHDIAALAFSVDSVRLAIGSRDRMISIWDVASGRREQMIAGHSGTVNQLVFSPTGDELLSSDTNGAVRVWDALPNREQDRYFPATYELVLSPQRTHLVGFGVGPRVQVWDVRTAGVGVELGGHQEAVQAATWSDDQRLVATASLDQTARVWDAATGRQIALMEGHTGWIFGVDVSPDAQRLATGGADRTARIWDTATGEELLRLDHPQEVNTVQFSRDGTRLFTGLSQSGDVMVWDSRSGALLATWSRHRFSIFAMALTADGTRLATASRDGEVRLWDAESGAEVLVLRGHTGDAFSVDFSPGGTLIATASNDATVRVWDAATGREVRAVPTGESAASAAFLDDSHLVVSTAANSATIITLDIEELISLGHQRLTRMWTAEECRQYLQAETCPTGP